MSKLIILSPVKYKPYLLLLVILVVAYLPVSTFYFGLKNDAFSDNFPNKYFFSQAVYSGFLPLWNPYLNFGFPIYADPGFAFWNPITWIFGAVIKYNAYTLTLEVLLYIYLAGITMYRLGRYLRFSSLTAVTVAAMYMCSGFFTGEIQHINFLTAAAFLPFLLQQFLTLFKSPGYKNACLTAIAYYLVCSGGHPAIPIGAAYFLITLTVAFLLSNKEYRQNWKQLFVFHLFSILIFLMLFSPALYSYLSVFGEYGRNMPVDQLYESDLHTGFSFSSFLSFIYPFSTVKSASLLTDDLTMRNAYFSFAGLILLVTQLRNKNALTRCLLAGALVMLLLSSGGFVKIVLYPHLPLLQFVRTNGEFRVFSILCFCCIAGFGLKNLHLHAPGNYSRYRRLLTYLLNISLLLLLLNATGFSSLYHVVASFNISASGMKLILDSLTFREIFLISILLNVVLIAFLLAVKVRARMLSIIIIIDLVVNSIAYLPFSGVGTVTLSDIQKVYEKTADGIPVPPLVRINGIDTLPAIKTGLTGSLSYYNKHIGTTQLTDYPSYFASTQTYFKSGLPSVINRLPYAFFKSDITEHLEDDLYSGNALSVSFFSPEKIIVIVNAKVPDSLVLLQNYYRFWKARVDGHAIPISKSFITFMSVPVSTGKHTVVFYYKDNWLPVFVLLSSFALALVAIIIVRSKKESPANE